MKKIFTYICVLPVSITVVFSQPTIRQSYRFLNETITFYSDSTFVETRKKADILPLMNIGDDTISYGKYLHDKNNYYLYTSPRWRSSTIELGNVQELDNCDSSFLHMQFQSPYQNTKSHHDYVNRHFFYMFTITLIGANNKTRDTLCGPYFGDIVDIGVGGEEEVERIDICIYPYNTFFITPEVPYLYSVYIPSNPKSKSYLIELPQFCAMYCFWRRYYGYVVPKLSRKAIFKDGEYWLRTDVYRLPKALQKRLRNSPYPEDNEY